VSVSCDTSCCFSVASFAQQYTTVQSHVMPRSRTILMTSCSTKLMNSVRSLATATHSFGQLQHCSLQPSRLLDVSSCSSLQISRDHPSHPLRLRALDASGFLWNPFHIQVLFFSAVIWLMPTNILVSEDHSCKTRLLQ
jgi:hypothetical protein